MSTPRSRLVVLPALAAVAILVSSSEPLQSQEFDRVIVTNFPAMQEVRGAVSIEGPLRVSESKVLREIVVPPVNRSESTRLVDAGVLRTDGFASVVISLHGQVKGTIQLAGRVGVYLLPDEKSILQAFNEQGLMHFSMEAAAGRIGSATAYFASDQPRYTVGFPAYRVFLYNETDRTVTLDLFAYLTN